MYLKLFFILLTCFSLFAQIPTDSLVAYYPFNGNAKNMVGNGNNDGIVKGATLVADRFGNINSAYHFVPGQDISVKNITLPAGNFSLSFWFKPEAYPTGATRLISGCYFSVAYWNDGHLGANGPSAPQINYNGIQLNKYYHIVFIYSNVAKLYVNNVLVGDSTAPAYTGCTNDSLIIGGYSVWPLASGCIDDIRIYRRSLTASEVSALYNEGITNPPPSPVTNLPPMRSLNVSTPTNLSWNTISGGSVYRLQISTSADFNHIIKDTSGLIDTQITLNLNNNTLYYWCVNATNNNGTSAWSITSSFTTVIAVPGAPILNFPLVGATNLPVSVPISWNLTQTATSYRLQVSSVSDFSHLLKDTSGIVDTFYFLQGLQNNTQYFWRVEAVNIGGISHWSITANFSTIVVVPSIPIVIYPISGIKNVSIPTNLIWQTVPMAKSYRIQISTTSDFNGIVKDSSGITDTIFNVYNLINNVKYYWCVNATNIVGTSNWSLTDSFITIVRTPSTISLISPKNKLQTDTALLIWNKESSAINYCFQVATDSNMTHLSFQDSILSDTFYLIKPLIPNVVYWWWVKAENIAGWNQFSPKVSFVYLPTAVLSQGLKKLFFSCVNNKNILSYTLPSRCFVSLKYYDVQGKEIASFINKEQNCGYYLFTLPFLHKTGFYIQVFKAKDYIKRKLINIQ